MKKHIFYLFLGAMAITACNPMDDINDEVDADIAAMKELQAQQASQTTIADNAETLVLSDDDYAALKDLKLTNSDLSADEITALEAQLNKASENKYFEKDANEFMLNSGLLAILSSNYNATNGQLVNVKYNVNDPFQLGTKVDYTATDADYASAGERHANFSKDYRIISFLNKKYDTFSKGDYVNLTYKFYDGKLHTYTKPMVYDGETFVITDRLQDAEYVAMGKNYKNFSSKSEADEFIVKYYNDKDIFAEEGDEVYVIVVVSEKIDGEYQKYDYIIRMEYKEGSYHVIGDVVEKAKHFVYISEEGQAYKYKWISIPPFKFVEITDEAVVADHNYTFTDADYEMVGNGRYHNFDFEPDHDAPELDHAKFIEMLGQVLRIQFATVESGTVVEVTYMSFTNETRAVEKTIKLRMDL